MVGFWESTQFQTPCLEGCEPLRWEFSSLCSLLEGAGDLVSWLYVGL